MLPEPLVYTSVVHQPARVQMMSEKQDKRLTLSENDWARVRNATSPNAYRHEMATVQTLSLYDQFQFAVICGFETLRH